MLVAYVILLDGEEVGRIRPGEEVELAAAAGVHRVQLSMQRMGRSDELSVDVRPDEVALLECGPAGAPGTALWDLLHIRSRSWIDLRTTAG